MLLLPHGPRRSGVRRPLADGPFLTLAVLVGLVAGCDARDTRGGEGLSPDEVAALAEMYPVLGEEPAPEPVPGANARRVPSEDVAGRLPEQVLHAVSGTASFYADTFEGRRTASGLPFRQNQMVAAHRGFPFGTILRVTNLDNDREVRVRVVDRGPFGGGESAARRIIDLSRRAATELGFIDAGTARVRLEVLEWGDGLGERG
jgi:rare lipoprotein A